MGSTGWKNGNPCRISLRFCSADEEMEEVNDLKPARILAIETSCDETAAAVLENGRAIYSSVVSSQMEMHARFGGVYPELASPQHLLIIMPLVVQALAALNFTFTLLR